MCIPCCVASIFVAALARQGDESQKSIYFKIMDPVFAYRIGMLKHVDIQKLFIMKKVHML